MKTQKVFLIIFTLMLTLFYNCSSEAQQKQNISPEVIAKRQTKMQNKAIAMDQAQVEQMKTINLQYAQKMLPLLQEIREDKSREKVKKLRSLNQEKNYEVSQVLSKEQYKKYLMLQKKMRKKLIERRKNKK